MIRYDVPELWKQRANAGLCPVCGKTKLEFDKGMIVYCSVKCRDEYAKRFEFWNTLRDKILKRDNFTCMICGTNKDKIKNSWDKSKQDKFSKFFEKEKKGIEAFRDLELKKLSEKYEEDFAEIMDNHKLFSRLRWELEKQFGEEYKELFEFSWKEPSLCVDHIKAIINNGDEWDEENLRCLCVECHKKKTKEDLLERKKNKLKDLEIC